MNDPLKKDADLPEADGDEHHPPLEPEVLDDDSGEAEDIRPLPVVRGSDALAPLDPLTAYLNEIRQYPELSAEEEKELALHYQDTGDVQAAYKLITNNLMLVVKIAMTFRREWQNVMDLIQEGNVGLMKAVKNFDPFRGVRLPAYASWWIKAYILKYILDNWRLVRVGTTNARRKLLYNLQKEKAKLEEQGFTATPKQLAEHFGVSEKDVIDVQASLGAADVSMDTPVHPDSEMTPGKSLSDGKNPAQAIEKSQFHEVLHEKIGAFLENMKPIEQELFATRILAEDPVSLKEIGEHFNITREAVRQTEQRLLKKFKTYITEHLPEAEHYFMK
ncbi:MAG: sigma-70 family RNA polymerase sigma factor [Nitrospina sp.]|nr:MAG: sigma-70 family RNA polymerase sigma factor [Nitrospina sp.]